jgi:hypothetical protein
MKLSGKIGTSGGYRPSWNPLARRSELASAEMDASWQRLERGVVHGNDGRETTSHEKHYNTQRELRCTRL